MLVLKKSGTGLETWTKLGADLGETRQHLDQLTVRLDNMAAGVEQGKGTAGKLLADTALADETQKLLVRAQETMSELQGVLTNLNVAVKNVQAGTERLPEITDAAADGARNLPALVQQTQTSMHEMERLIEALQRSWFVRKYMDKTNAVAPRSFPSNGKPDPRPLKAARSPETSAK
jgi:methyl-accepting chemotaxis protein